MDFKYSSYMIYASVIKREKPVVANIVVFYLIGKDNRK